MKSSKTLEICMGSSCFARGNREFIHIIEEYINTNTLEVEVNLRGCLCNNECGNGPVMKVDDVEHNQLTEEKVMNVLESL